MQIEFCTDLMDEEDRPVMHVETTVTVTLDWFMGEEVTSVDAIVINGVDIARSRSQLMQLVAADIVAKIEDDESILSSLITENDEGPIGNRQADARQMARHERSFGRAI